MLDDDLPEWLEGRWEFGEEKRGEEGRVETVCCGKTGVDGKDTAEI